MKKLLLLMLLPGAMWGQTTVFSEQFNTSRGATYSNANGAIGSDTRWLMQRSGDDWGARIDGNILDLSNDASATANVDGWCFGHFNNSTHAIFPWRTTLNANPGTVTWEFNMRQIRTNPAGFVSGEYAVSFVLAGTSSSVNNTGQGYAIVLGNNTANDPIRLAHYNNGLGGTLTNIITSNTSGLDDFGADYLSIRVTYKPINDTWEMFIRNDGASAFADPTSGTLISQGKVVNSTYTSTADMNFTGGYWQGSTVANQTAFFDNVYMKVACEPKLNTATKTGLTERCRDASWKYYGDNTGIYLAIDTNGNTFTTSPSVTVGSTIVKTSSNGANQEHGMWLMGRYWDASLSSGSISTTVSVRFYYDPADTLSAFNARDAAFTALPGTTLARKNPRGEWFKTPNGTVFNSTYISTIIGNKFPTGGVLKPTTVTGIQNGVNYVEYQGLTGFSGGTIGFSFGPNNGSGANGLPVTWAGFDAMVNTDHTELLWQTASEQHTSHFEVEASEDGKVFNTISENIPAAGNSASLLRYSFIDRNLTPIKYYRLRQVDMESSFEYSKIIVTKRSEAEKQGFDIVVYPVSETNNKQYHLLLKNKVEDVSTIQIVDYTGKPVFNATSTKNAELLDLHYLTPGIYMLQVWNGEEKQVERVVVR